MTLPTERLAECGLCQENQNDPREPILYKASPEHTLRQNDHDHEHRVNGDFLKPESKVCQSCRQVFYRRPAPLDSSFRWMRRKFCTAACYRVKGQFIGSPRPAPRQQGVGNG